MKYILPMLAAACMLSACGDNSANTSTDAAATDAAATADAAPAADAAASTETAAAGGEISTGVPECDEYVNKVMACIRDKIPEAQRGAIEQAMNQTRQGWSSIQDKSALANACRTALDQAKASYAAMGCSF